MQSHAAWMCLFGSLSLLRSSMSFTIASRVSSMALISSPRVSKIVIGTPSLVISRMSVVMGRPEPVSALLPWNTELMSVLLPTPERPAMMMLKCPRSLSAFSVDAFINSVTKIFRRDLLHLNNLNQDDGLKTDEDFIMNIKAFAKCTCCVIVDKCFYRINYREDSLSHSYFKKNISKYISNRFYRAQLIEKTLSEECPELMEWAYLQNIMYFNALIGRITTFPSLFLDKRTRETISYIRKHWNVLTKYHWKCGFSKLGCYLLKYMPIYLYMYYRRMKIQK